MGAESGFFFNSLLIAEIADWYQSTGERPGNFAPLARAREAVSTVLCESAEEGRAIGTDLKNWCDSEDFVALITSAFGNARNIWLDEAIKHFSAVTGNKITVGSVPIEVILRAFSAIVRTELRGKDSRSTVRLDELLVWQANFESISEHSFGLWLLCNLLDGTNMRFFDQLSNPQRLQAIKNTGFSEDAELVFRPCIVSGIKHVAVGNFDDATKAFNKAISLSSPHEPLGLIGLALTELLRGNRSSAQLLLRNASCTSPVTHAARIFVCGGDLPGHWPVSSDAEGLPADDHQCSDLCMQALSYVHLERREFEAARKALTRVAPVENYLGSEPAVITLLLMAESEFQEARLLQFDDPPVPFAPEADYVERLMSATQYLERVLETTDSFSLSTCGLFARRNLACILMLRRNFKRAESLLEQVLSEEPANVSAVQNKGIVLLALGRLPEVYDTVASLRGLDAVRAGRAVADAWYHSGDLQQCLTLNDQLLEHEYDRLWRMRLMIRKLEVLRMLRRQKDAQACTDELIRNFRAEPELLFSLGCELVQNRQFDQAVELLQKAKIDAPPNLKRWISWELARLYCRQDKILSATDEYAMVADKNVDSIQSREFAMALFRAGLKSAAYERAVLLRESRGAIIPGVSEIEVDCLIGMGRVEEARDLLRELEAIRPLSVANKLAMIRLSIELGELTAAHQDLLALAQLSIPESARKELAELETDLLARANQG
ncbi:MAG: hypothetical protein K2W95_30405 [Candidatus Obscuribacterales bacterium]|nr:hypothetical protein [Candidatus Obscuribacterales bacterium]